MQTIHHILVFYKNMLQILVKHAFRPNIVIRNAFSPQKKNLNREAPMGQNYHQYRINVLEIVYMFTTTSTLNPSVTNAQLLHKLASGRWNTVSWFTSKAALSCSVFVLVCNQSSARSWTGYLELLLYIMWCLWIISVTQDPKKSFGVRFKFAFAPLSNFS